MTEKNKMPKKHDGDSAFNKLTRLLRLIKYVAEHGKNGVYWKDIRSEIYDGDPADPVISTKDDTLLRKFMRDRSDINSSFYIDEDDDYADDDIHQDEAIIQKNKDGKYVIRNGLNLMLPMKLKKEEALALASGVRLISEFITPLHNASNNLWLRLKNQMSDEILSGCEFLISATTSAIPIAQKVDHDVFMNMIEALNEKQYISINEYATAWPDDLERCKFAPHIIYLKYHSWYAYGEVSGKKRILRLDRIKSAELCDEYQEDFPTAEELDELTRDIQLDYNPYKPFKKMPAGGWKIKLRITGSFVQPCLETVWFPGEKKTFDEKSKTLIYEVNLKGLEAITLWIMRALNCMEVLEPAELRDEIDRRVDTYLESRKANQK